ncbi:MAG: threonine/serine exporter family protein [Clostridia bacterium]|nr:threonine/serine exporter family protein [Clostridia bacterium]
MVKEEILQIIASFIGSMGFAILFNIRGNRLFAASIGGLLSWLFFILINKAIGSEVVAYFLVSCIISVYAEIMARIMKSPTTTFVITSLIPMIPGGSLYYTMVSAFQNNGNDFFQKATHTLELAAALALGVVVVTAFMRMFHKSANQ